MPFRLYRVVALPGRIAAALLLLAGCATTAPNVGAGPINLTANVMLKLELYMTSTRPGAFAVSPNGAYYGATICDKAGCDEYEDENALLLCKATSNDQDCRLFMRRNDLVWDGPITYSREYYFGEQPSDMPVALYWEPPETNTLGDPWQWGYAFRHFNGDFLLYFRPSRLNGDCVGSIDRSTKPKPTFGLFCTDRDSVSGEMSPQYGRYNASNGTAYDSTGNFVEIVIVPRSPLRNTVIRPSQPFPEARHE